MSEEESSETLKTKANESFARGEFSTAMELYSQAIEKAQTDKNLLAILHSNRSAARIELGQEAEAVEDATIALAFNPSYVKAYLRKATALLRLGDEYGSYTTWKQAGEICEQSPALKKQLKDSLARWLLFYNKVPVISSEDLLNRYMLADKNTRLKLSTLAHFWNISSKAERLEYLRTFLALIGGEGNLSEESQRMFALDNMEEMPMHNYPDLPRENIEPWCVFVEGLESTEKCRLLRSIWDILSSFEQNLVILDLKAFVAMPKQQASAFGGSQSDNTTGILEVPATDTHDESG